MLNSNKFTRTVLVLDPFTNIYIVQYKKLNPNSTQSFLSKKHLVFMWFCVTKNVWIKIFGKKSSKSSFSTVQSIHSRVYQNVVLFLCCNTGFQFFSFEAFSDG